jgi:hypothetical protein
VLVIGGGRSGIEARDFLSDTEVIEGEEGLCSSRF